MKHLISSLKNEWLTAAVMATVMVFCMPVAAHAMQIFIDPAVGSTFSLEVEPSDSIENVKSRIEDHMDLLPNAQRLVYTNGERLEEGRTLSDYTIQAEDTIAVVQLTDGRAAKTINVTTTSGGSCTWESQFESCTLQEALNAAAYAYYDDTTIDIGAGLYQSANAWSYASIYPDQSVSLIGAGHTSTFIENTNEEPADVMDLFVAGALTVRGIVFQGGGVGLLAQDSEIEGEFTFDVVIDDCIFKDNENGGLNIQDLHVPGSLTITGSQFLNNERSGFGAGLYASAGYSFPMTIGGTNASDGNSFDGNTSTGASGGAIYFDVNADNSPVSILHNTIANNTADAYGAGLFGYPSEGLDMRFNTIDANLSGSAGAAMNLTLDGSSGDTADYVISSNIITNNSSPSPINLSSDMAGTFTMDNNLLSGNVSSGQPSQIIFFHALSAPLLVRNNVIVNNRSATNAGALIVGTFFSDAGNDIRLINNTFSNNTATNYGAGALYVSNNGDDTWNFYNNIFWDNYERDTVGRDIQIEDDRGTAFNFKYNTYQGVYGNGTKDNGTDFLNIAEGFSTAGNVSTDPLFTNAGSGTYTLRSGSLAINSASADAPSLPTVDRNGVSRGGAPDRGAYEYTGALAPVTGTTSGGGGFGGVLQPVTGSLNQSSGKMPLVRTLRMGMLGDDVKKLQEMLNALGFPVAQTGPGSKGHETTLFGKKTRLAVVAFQKAHGLKADGVVGLRTWEALTAK